MLSFWLTIDSVTHAVTFPAKVAAALSVSLTLGLALTIVLPGKTSGYRLASLAIRLYNVFWLALLGVLGLAAAAIVVIACMQIISLPMALGALFIAAAAAACMTLAALYCHHLAACLNELSVSARAGSWQSPAAYKCSMRGMCLAMDILCLAVLAGELLCARYATHDAMVTIFSNMSEAVYAAAPTGARTLVRTLCDEARPLLDVPMTSVVRRGIEAWRYAAIAVLYREYVRMNATFKAQ